MNMTPSPDASHVAIVTAGASYGSAPDANARVAAAINRVISLLGWGNGTLASGIAAGARVLIKPNWVSHANQGTGGFEPLVTHESVIRAVTEAVLLGEPEAVLIGDAPLQGCDFEALLDASHLRQWCADLQKRDARFRGIHDFRRTQSAMRWGVRKANEHRRSPDRFTLFDLRRDSLLEPVTRPGAFRVTQYNPVHMMRTHAPGTHQYLIAREVLEADLVINLPKLKTHKKAGITCALKNLIGINGNKEFLPHHRIGGELEGGDCYPGRSRIKHLLEATLDLQNGALSALHARTWGGVGWVLDRIAHLVDDDLGVEGSWSGNDTIWRTCLDLNRILLYGRTDGTLAPMPQRQVLHIVDAIVAGQGEGPLAPVALPLGMLLAGTNAAAIDVVGSWLLGYDPERIPITREAFGAFRWPLASFQASDVWITGDLGSGPAADLLLDRAAERGVLHPRGWRDAASARSQNRPSVYDTPQP